MSASRPRNTSAVKSVCASETGSDASCAMERSCQSTARDTGLSLAPWQLVQTCVCPSYQAFQTVSSPVCSASNPSSCRPVPKHEVHQPCLELYENMRGSGSGKLVPHEGHARLTEKCSCVSGAARFPRIRSSGQTMLMTPWPFSSAARTVSRNAASSLALTVRSPTGSSIVCSLNRSSLGQGEVGTKTPSTRRCV